MKVERAVNAILYTGTLVVLICFMIICQSQKNKIDQLEKECGVFDDTLIIVETHYDTVSVFEQMDDLYDTVVSFIKKHEGFRPSIYKDINGNPTIGYGHLIKKRDTFTHKCILTEKQAEDILKDDLNRALKLVDKYTNLKGRKRLAMGHFVYCKGIGTFIKIILPIIHKTETVISTLRSLKYRNNREFEISLWIRK